MTGEVLINHLILLWASALVVKMLVNATTQALRNKRCRSLSKKSRLLTAVIVCSSINYSKIV